MKRRVTAVRVGVLALLISACNPGSAVSPSATAPAGLYNVLVEQEGFDFPNPVPVYWRAAPGTQARYRVTVDLIERDERQCGPYTINPEGSPLDPANSAFVFFNLIDVRVFIEDLAAVEDIASRTFEGPPMTSCPETYTFTVITGTTMPGSEDVLPEEAPVSAWVVEQLVSRPELAPTPTPSP